MSKVLAAALALVVFAAPLAPLPAVAKKSIIIRHHDHDHDHGPHPKVYDGTMDAFAYPDCLPWSPKLQTWVWVCGPPYPPGIPLAR